MPVPHHVASDPAWYCLRSKRKAEHQAVGHLRQIEGVEAFSPRLRFQRPTRRGKVWFVEAAFPAYVFARFQPAIHLAEVRHCQGITGVVSFGEGMPVIPEAEIQALRELVGDDEVHEVPDVLKAGDEAELVAGPFRGLRAVVSRVMPARDRVAILLEFLGSLREVEVDRDIVAGPPRPPGRLSRDG